MKATKTTCNMLAALCALAVMRANAEGSHEMWLRNNGAWESIVRVNKEKPYWDLGSFVGYTNGCEWVVVTTNGCTIGGYMREGVPMPVRMGVPQSIVVDLPYTDLLEVLPSDYPQTRIRVRTGFDGYLLLRYDEQEDRITIKRLLPEKLPYERTPRNIRVSREDFLYGV